MLWRVRATLHDRPGSLARLAAGCGEAGVNILGLQIFPEIDRVTDELVVRTPPGWRPTDLADLVASAGGTAVGVMPCTEAALTDQPTRYVHAARTLSDRPAAFLDVVARLFDAEPDPEQAGATEQDLMELTVCDVTVQVRRTAVFTATERARAAALAELVSEMLSRRQGPTAVDEGASDGSPSFEVDVASARALVAGHEIGRARWQELPGEQGVRDLSLSVDPAWRRLGVGSRLLLEAARAAQHQGVDELVLHSSADNQAVLPLVMSIGLRARIGISADTLTVRIPVRQLVAGR